jgi:hypothetical protein
MAEDQVGNTMVPQASCTWTVSGGGTVIGFDSFTAGRSAGSLLIQAEHGGGPDRRLQSKPRPRLAVGPFYNICSELGKVRDLFVDSDRTTDESG